ncbi:MAG TPA: hypothetical protein VM115_13140 [Vicinamibacterales bacterium]|nr:hypothetical protein [Vicinamibacterales bacterium]
MQASNRAPNRPHGFYTPAKYLYELQGQVTRAVRVRVDVGIHTGKMTLSCTQERADWPMRMLARRVMPLTARFIDTRSDSPKAFHQSFMQMGTVPVVFFRDVFAVPVVRNVRLR